MVHCTLYIYMCIVYIYICIVMYRHSSIMLVRWGEVLSAKPEEAAEAVPSTCFPLRTLALGYHGTFLYRHRTTYTYMGMCICIYIYTHIHTHTYIYTYIPYHNITLHYFTLHYITLIQNIHMLHMSHMLHMLHMHINIYNSCRYIHEYM